MSDHLPENFEKISFANEFKGECNRKDAIHAIGIPRGEVDLILVNGQSVGFDHQMQEGAHFQHILHWKY